MFQSPGYLWLLLLLPYFLWLGWPDRGKQHFGEYAALFFRGVLIVCLILGLAEFTIRIPNDHLSVLYLLDVSDSIQKTQQQAAVNLIQQSIKAKPADDLAGLIVFGKNALVETPLSATPEVDAIQSVPGTSQTDIGEAMNLAQALFPSDTAKRIVLLSDGKNNQGSMHAAIQVAITNGIDLMQIPIGSTASADAAITDLQLPSRLSPGKRFDLTFTIYSSISQPALVRVLTGGIVVSEQDLLLSEGEQSYTLSLVSDQTGVNEFEVQLINANDSVIQNNRLSGVTYVTGPPRVLVVSVPAGGIYPNGETRPDEADALIGVLESSNFEYDLVRPENLPLEPGELAHYNAVILIDVPGRDLSQLQMRTLQSYVRDLGGGLVTIGGLTSYGVGGYYDTPLAEALPINMQNQDEVRHSTLALVFVIDRSNSMTDTSGGISKLELAKEAVLRSIDLLMPTDKVGVVVFDSTPRWVSPITEVENKDAIKEAVGSIRSGGGTNILSGLQAVARELPADDAQVKHIILLTDGGASPSGIPEIVQRMNQVHEITLTSVGVGNDAAPFLPDLALLGGGRFHHVSDPQTIPSIFTEETTLATRSYVVEQPFTPQVRTNSPILAGINTLPVLHGYVTSSPKEAGTVILASDHGDPILAAWQYGLGKSAAFTSDATGRWARNWLTWTGFASFWSQTISYVSSPVDSSNIEMDVQANNGAQTISVMARNEIGETLNSFEVIANIVSQEGEMREVRLRQTGAGKYQAQIDTLAPGSYTISLSGKNLEGDERFMETFGWSQGYSPEYVPMQITEDSNAQISPLVAFTEDANQVFKHNLPLNFSIRPVWRELLLMGVVLLVMDIAVRRLRISNQELEKSWCWLKDAVLFSRRSMRTGTAASERISALLEVKVHTRKMDWSQDVRGRQSLIIPLERVVPEQGVPKIVKGKNTEPGSTAAVLLSRKRERNSGKSTMHK